jgi:enoyl-CoA hydratase/carnithine racemase
VRLDRPQQRNAIDRQMVDELHHVCAVLERDPRLLILTGGVDGNFAAGADIAELRERRREDALAGINLGLFERIRGLPLPSVAAIDGPALGGGAELAYACDLRIATPRARFGQPEVQLGIMAAAGGAFRLAEIVGEALAKELLFTGRVISADEALAAGLVSRVVPPEALLAVADELCDAMARASTVALRLTKLAVNAPRAAHPAIDLVGQAVLFETAEKLERMDEFLERRTRRSAES